MKRTVQLLLFAIVVGTMNAQSPPPSSGEPSRNTPFDTLYLPFRHIGIEDGLSQGMVLSIVQDRAGFMWFATKDGLNRYDGYSFRVFRNDPKDSTSLRDNHVLAVHEDRAGLLWVGTNSGLDVFDPATEIFHHFPCGDRSSAFRLSGVTQCATSIIMEDPAGHLWVWAGRGLYRITPDRANAITGPGTRIELLGDGKEMIVIAMTVDAGGLLRASSRPDHGGAGHSLIINTRDEEGIAAMIADPPLLTWSPIVAGQGEEQWAAFATDTVRHVTYTFDRTALEVHGDASAAVRTIPLAGAGWEGTAEATTDAHGALWGISPRLWRIDPRTGRVSRLLPASADLALEASSVECLYRDRSGVMWMGTNGFGVLMYDLRGERFHTRPTRSARAMTALRDGRVLVMAYVYQYYVVGEQGITLALSDRKALDMRAFEPCVVEEGRGVLWSNPDFALARYDKRDGSTQRFAEPDLPVRFPLHLQGDSLISFGSTNAFGQFNTRTQRFNNIPYPIAAEGGGYEFVQAICSDAQGIFWLGTMKGLLRLDPRTETWTRYTNDPDDPHSLSTDKIFCLLNDAKDPDILWVGTNGGGLNRLDKRTGQFTRFSTNNGLPNNVIYGLLADDDGQLWMSTNKGIARFDPVTHEVRSFDASDGLQGDEFNRYAFCKAANGELYFGGINGINHFRPEELRNDTAQVQVCITDIRSMNRSIAFGAEGSPLDRSTHLARELVIPYSEARMLTFDFASMDYGALGNRQYQYQLENFDPERINAGLTRWATFTNLDPGEYTFKVWGRNRDGVWNTVPTTLRLNILPPWYLTTWSKVLAALLVLSSIVTYNRLRTRSLRLQRDKLEQKVQVRTSELNVALQRSDELLHNILPDEVAAELKAKGTAEAVQIDQATVLFTDFKGFTTVSEQLSASELVKELNVCFKAFDGIITARGIEKIKTIGDAYMCAGGLPDPKSSSPADVVRAALEMQDFMRQRKAERDALSLPAFEMRLGVHTGPVVAGIVGVKKFQYDIWGDTVNTASRMESSGEVGQVNISEATYALVKDEPGLTFTPRGKVSAKGKGEMEMYFVENT